MRTVGSRLPAKPQLMECSDHGQVCNIAQLQPDRASKGKVTKGMTKTKQTMLEEGVSADCR